MRKKSVFFRTLELEEENGVWCIYKNARRPCEANERVIARHVVTNKVNQKKAAVVQVRISWLRHIFYAADISRRGLAVIFNVVVALSDLQSGRF